MAKEAFGYLGIVTAVTFVTVVFIMFLRYKSKKKLEAYLAGAYPIWELGYATIRKISKISRDPRVILEAKRCIFYFRLTTVITLSLALVYILEMYFY